MRTWFTAVMLSIVSVACSGEPGPTEQSGRPTVEIVTSLGPLTIELWPEKSPQTVDNFLTLVDDGFFEGTIFHRVIPNFMIQAGGYDTALNYRDPPRTVVNESANGMQNARWTIAMARHADPDSADSQFFINMNDNKHLDAEPGKPGYTVFGMLVAGHEIAEDIELTDTGPVGDKVSVPLEPIVIVSARRVDAAE